MVSTVGSVSSLGGAGDGRSSFDSPFTAGATRLLLASAPSDPISSMPECGAAHSPLTDATGVVHQNQRPDATVVVAVVVGRRRQPRSARGGGIRTADAAARGEKKGLGWRWRWAGAAAAALRRSDAWVATDVGMGRVNSSPLSLSLLVRGEACVAEQGGTVEVVYGARLIWATD
jgi:hypothetical protein